jgi:hypothetical protein
MDRQVLKMRTLARMDTYFMMGSPADIATSIR